MSTAKIAKLTADLRSLTADKTAKLPDQSRVDMVSKALDTMARDVLVHLHMDKKVFFGDDQSEQDVPSRKQRERVRLLFLKHLGMGRDAKAAINKAIDATIREFV